MSLLLSYIKVLRRKNNCENRLAFGELADKIIIVAACGRSAVVLCVALFLANVN